MGKMQTDGKKGRHGFFLINDDGKGSHYLYITINDDAKRQNGHKGKDIYRVLSIAEILKYF